MTDRIEFLFDALEHGFELREHPVKFAFHTGRVVQLEVAMLCFAELRDVLKISDVHT